MILDAASVVAVLVVRHGIVELRHSRVRQILPVVSAVTELSKAVLVALSLLVVVGVIMHHARQLAVIVVVVQFQRKMIAGVWHPCHVHLAMPRVHHAVVAAFLGGISDVVESERIVILCIYVLAHHSHAHLIAQVLVIAHERIGVAP